MGLTVQWAVRCENRMCIQKIYDSLKKLDEGFLINKPNKNAILACTGMEKGDLCIRLNFEPWEKAIQQSYVMRKARFRVIGFGDPVFDGEGPFGHVMPDEMMKYIDGREGRCSWETIDSDPVLGEGGLQTGDWVKTQYHGIEQHLKTCKILDTIRDNADKAVIGDDGHYCGDGDKHDMATLMDNFEEYTDLMINIGKKLGQAGWSDENVGGKGEETYKRSKSVKK